MKPKKVEVLEYDFDLFIERIIQRSIFKQLLNTISYYFSFIRMKLSSITLCFSFVLIACYKPTKRLIAYEVEGIDVSRHQKQINWDLVVKQDIDFVFVKATEGVELVDAYFDYNSKGVRRVGLKFGAYHFFHPTIDAKLQAENFIKTVQFEKGDLPPVLDFEVLNGVAKEEIIKGMTTWLRIIEQTYAVRPIIYTNSKLYFKYIKDNFEGYPIWIARYNSEKTPMINDWCFWQYGNRGLVDGINGYVDLNVFHGSLIELEGFCFPTEQ